jgi:hypothetical protein
MNALTSLPIRCNADGAVARAPHPLPDHFPKSWLNIFDPRDFLSYMGAKVFGDTRVRDIEVDNKESFPESHGAYWANAEVWNAITARLKGEA